MPAANNGSAASSSPSHVSTRPSPTWTRPRSSAAATAAFATARSNQVRPSRRWPPRDQNPGSRLARWTNVGDRTVGIEPLQGGAHIGVLGLESVEWTLLCPSRPAQRVDQVRAIVGVRFAGRRFLAAGRELLQGELADRLQHPETRHGSAAAPVCSRTRLLSTSAATSASVDGALSSPRDRLRGLQGEPPGEDPQPPKQALLLGLEELVTPGDRVPHRLLAIRPITSPTCQQRQAGHQPLG